MNYSANKYAFGIGPLSKNIVDACIDFSNRYNVNICFIPSRRQMDISDGYSNNWTTKSFSEYVKSKSKNVSIKRDHAGPNQGSYPDDGIDSILNDCKYFEYIHIDPWKVAKDFNHGCELTKKYIDICYDANQSIAYEIGTEESIFKYESEDLEKLILFLKHSLEEKKFNRIKFAVIQCGTSLAYNENLGQYDEIRLEKMIKVCNKHNLISKEHNGDYLQTKLIYQKFDKGLHSINLAPEFGQIETNAYLTEILDTDLLERFFEICNESKKWQKWVDKDFNPNKNKIKTINICGHYVLSDQKFINEIKNKIRFDIDRVIKNKITLRLNELYEKFKN